MQHKLAISEGQQGSINSFPMYNKKYVLWNVHLPNALHSVCL